MAIQYSTTLRNNQLDQVESTVSTTPLLRIYTGAAPTNCGTAASGTLLVEMTLPSDWMNAASSGSKTKNGTWEDASANNTGTAGHFRIYESTGTTCHMQGTCGQGTGDLQLDNTSIVSGQKVTVTTFTISAGNA
jgi:hypothetical protein